MFEKLGKRKFAVPLLVAVVIACVMSVMFYPMANMEMKGLPFAVLSLDEGVEGPQGTVNAGDALVENVTAAADAGDGGSPIAWTQVGSQGELDEALENGEFYGALIVPEGFKRRPDGGEAGRGRRRRSRRRRPWRRPRPKPRLRPRRGTAAPLALWQAKARQPASLPLPAPPTRARLIRMPPPTWRPRRSRWSSTMREEPRSAASQTKASMASMFQQMGVDVGGRKPSTRAMPAPLTDAAAANPMAGMMSQQLTIMPLFLMSFAGGPAP